MPADRQIMTLAPETTLAVPPVTDEQRDLITRTVAKDATPDELRLYLYDCARQGVHPLDRLLHFTKRGGKYTPVTSIDLMRMRAADTGEYAGNDEYEFTGTPGRTGFKATARVWRLVQGQKVSFTRPARWEEYCPPAGQDHMWRRMPHVMLGKCAEAQALRAGFPRQLHGLYAAEELQSAETPPPPPPKPAPRSKSLEEAARETLATVEAREAPMRSYDTVVPPPKPKIQTIEEEYQSAPPAEGAQLPDGFVLVERIDSAPTKNPNVTKYRITLSTGETVTTINTALATLAADACEHRTPVRAETKATKWGTDLVKLHPVDEPAAPLLEPLDDWSIPF